MKKVKETTNQVKTWILRAVTLVIAIALALVGMSILHFINLPEMIVKFVGYLLIVSAVVYIAKHLK